MQRQVITFQPDGTVSGLQVKPGKGLNLQSLGKAKTIRASEIVWDEDAQAWYVDVLQTPGTGKVTLGAYCTANPARPCIKDYAPTVDDTAGWDDVLMFGSYEDAVAVEIAYLDALRLRGEFPRS